MNSVPKRQESRVAGQQCTRGRAHQSRPCWGGSVALGALVPGAPFAHALDTTSAEGSSKSSYVTPFPCLY